MVRNTVTQAKIIVKKADKDIRNRINWPVCIISRPSIPIKDTLNISEAQIPFPVNPDII